MGVSPSRVITAAVGFSAAAQGLASPRYDDGTLAALQSITTGSRYQLDPGQEFRFGYDAVDQRAKEDYLGFEPFPWPMTPFPEPTTEILNVPVEYPLRVKGKMPVLGVCSDAFHVHDLTGPEVFVNGVRVVKQASDERFAVVTNALEKLLWRLPARTREIMKNLTVVVSGSLSPRCHGEYHSDHRVLIVF